MVQASTVGAAFLTKTLPELNVKFEIWWVGAPIFDDAQARKERARPVALLSPTRSRVDGPMAWGTTVV